MLSRSMKSTWAPLYLAFGFSDGTPTIAYFRGNTNEVSSDLKLSGSRLLLLKTWRLITLKSLNMIGKLEDTNSTENQFQTRHILRLC